MTGGSVPVRSGGRVPSSTPAVRKIRLLLSHEYPSTGHLGRNTEYNLAFAPSQHLSAFFGERWLSANRDRTGQLTWHISYFKNLQPL